MHGVFDVGCVVFQAKNEELFFVKDSEPVQKVHSIQTDLEPHLEPKKKAGVTSGVMPPTLFPKYYGTRTSQHQKSYPREQLPSKDEF